MDVLKEGAFWWSDCHGSGGREIRAGTHHVRFAVGHFDGGDVADGAGAILLQRTIAVGRRANMES